MTDKQKIAVRSRFINTSDFFRAVCSISKKRPFTERGLKMAAEKNFENKIKTWLKNHNCYYVKFFANAYTRRGVPDILASVNGWFIGIEVKADSGRPSELQLDNIQLIRDSGGYAWVVYPSGFEKLQTRLVNLLNNQVFNNLESEVILK